jgi:acyl-CoA reductase-like NAD-dependent aldehyde dehydrogenase
MKIITVNPAIEEILAEYDAIHHKQVNHEVKNSRIIFSDIKNSGMGQDLSNYGLKEFVNVKSVVVN